MTDNFEVRFDRQLLFVGKLNYMMWTDTESPLIHPIAALTRANKDISAIIFLTLNTTSARINLVKGLVKMDGRPGHS